MWMIIRTLIIDRFLGFLSHLGDSFIGLGVWVSRINEESSGGATKFILGAIIFLLICSLIGSIL